MLLVAVVIAALIASTRGSSAATPVRYDTVAATTGSVTDRISATGTVAAEATVDLGFGTSSERVTAVDVHPGQSVTKGQLLATVDDTAAALQVDTAQAQLNLATAQASSTPTATTDGTAGSSGSGPAAGSTGSRTSCTTTTTVIEPAPTQTAPSYSPRPTSSPQPSGTPAPTPTATPAAGPSGTSTPEASPSGTPTSAAATEPAPSRSADPGSRTAPGRAGPVHKTTKVCTTTESGAGATRGGATASGVRSSGSTGTGGGTGTAGNSGSGSATSIDDAQQQLTAAQTALAGTKLVAPQSGVITAVNLVVGALPATPAVELRTTGLTVQVPVQEQDAPYVQAGQSVQLTFSALGLSGTGSVVAAPLEPQTATGSSSTVVSYPVTVSIADPPPALLPGMSVSASWTAATRNQVLTVPTSAIQSGDAGYIVRVLVDGTPVSRPVTVGLSDTSLTEVTSGLSPGDPVVTGVRT